MRHGLRRVALVVGFVALSVPLSAAPAASAAPLPLPCPEGSTLVESPAAFMPCEDPLGNVTGYVNRATQVFSTEAQPATVQALTRPASVLASEVPSAGSPGVGLAQVGNDVGAVGSAGEAGAVDVLPEAAGLNPVVGVVGAFGSGLYLGNKAASGMCGYGISVLCVPPNCSQGLIAQIKEVFTGCNAPDTAPPNTPANGDVVILPQGFWVPPGGAAPPVSFTAGPYTVTGYSVSFDGAVTYKGTTVDVSAAPWSLSISPSGGWVNGTAWIICVDNHPSGQNFQGMPQNLAAGGHSGDFAIPSATGVCATDGGIDHIDFVAPAVYSGASYQGRPNGGSDPYCSGGGCPGSNTVLAVYFPQGESRRPADTSPNPNRYLKVTDTCVDSNGNPTLEVGTSAAFHETDASLPSWPTPPDCPSGTVLSKTSWTETGDGVAAKTVLPDYVVPDAVKTWEQNFPECVGNPNCHTKLNKVGPAGTSTGSCLDDAGLCTGWFTDPDKTDDYQCTYGPDVDPTPVDLSECNMYAPSFEPAKVAAGVAYGDPKTGASADTNPVTDPTTGKSASTDPTTPDPTGASSGAHGSCFPSGWGALNPVEWVEQPVKCALEWAFVPDSSTMTSLANSIGGGPNSTVKAWGNAWEGMFAPLAATGNSNCDGIPVDLNLGPIDQKFQLLNACSEPMKTAASISYAFTTFIVVVLGGLSAMRGLTAPFDFRMTIGEYTKVRSVG